MIRLAFPLVLAALTACHSPEAANSSTAEAQTPDVARLRERIRDLSRDRATPDRAVASYFEAAEIQQQLNCHEAAKQRRDATQANVDVTLVADAFFHGEALEVRRRYRRELQDCLRLQDRQSMSIRDVNMDTATHATIVVHLKNTTPIPSSAVATDDDRRRRRDGQEFRVQMTRADGGWKIGQVSTRYSEGGEWRPQFSSEEYFPSFVFFPTQP